MSSAILTQISKATNTTFILSFFLIKTSELSILYNDLLFLEIIKYTFCIHYFVLKLTCMNYVLFIINAFILT